MLFYFCDNHSPGYGTLAYILRVFCSQIIRFGPDFVPFFYDEYLAKAKSPSETVLREALLRIIPNFDDVRMVVDGIDELPKLEPDHHRLLKDLILMTSIRNNACKLLISSQDLPSIRPTLSRKPALCLGEEEEPIKQDVETIVLSELNKLNGILNNALDARFIEELQSLIVQKAEGKQHRNLNCPIVSPLVNC